MDASVSPQSSPSELLLRNNNYSRQSYTLKQKLGGGVNLCSQETKLNFFHQKSKSPFGNQPH